MSAHLSDWLHKAQDSNWALPHFNISTGDQLRTIIEACQQLKSPIIIGASEGEVDFLGYGVVRKLIDYWQETTALPIFLNADHHHSLERAKQAIDAGFDSVNIDLSLKSELDNLAETKAVVEYAHSKNKHINIEGEIGALATQSSEILKEEVVIASIRLKSNCFGLLPGATMP